MNQFMVLWRHVHPINFANYMTQHIRTSDVKEGTKENRTAVIDRFKKDPS